MDIQENKIKIKDLVKHYKNNSEEGVIAFDGKLNLRPPYQREFVYKPEQQEAVINTILKGLPLNIMYWSKNNDNTFEILDGQQRSISICSFINGDFSINNYRTKDDNYYFHNLTQDIKDKILNYELLIYICEGTDSEKLEWFKTINIAGEKLTHQELRNAVYTGTWLTDAKTKFSKTNCVAFNLAKDYIGNKSPIRQELLELAISWTSNNTNIEKYMAKHQHDPNASELWGNFQNIINWIKVTFPYYRKELKKVKDWNILYFNYKNTSFDTDKLEKQISNLMTDDDVTNKAGLYNYVLTNNEKYLNIRSFTDNQKRSKYEKQKGICPLCKNHFIIDDMEGDHITPWAKGGKTNIENLQMICKPCNRKKSSK